MLWIIINDFILMIAKQLAVTINKNNTTAVSAASKPHTTLVKSKIFISKWMFPASTKKRFNPIAAIEYETSNLNNLYLWMNIPMNPIIVSDNMIWLQCSWAGKLKLLLCCELMFSYNNITVIITWVYTAELALAWSQ